MSAMLDLSWSEVEDRCVVAPEEVNMLARILVRVCAERDLRRDGEEANYCASRLVYLFQSGVTDEQALFSLVSGRA